MRTRVCVLSSVHSDNDVRIFHKECRALSDAGYDVTYVVPADGSERCRDGVRIVPIPAPAGRASRMTRTAIEVYRAAIRQDALVYHFQDPELVWVGLLLKARGKHVFYDVHEDLPRQVLSKDWIPPAVRKLVSRAVEAIEAVAAKSVDGVIAATPAIARRFPAGKTVTVQNFPALAEFSVTEGIGAVAYSSREPIVCYPGGLTRIQGLTEMVQAMDVVRQNCPVRLVLAGAFASADLEEEVRKLPGWRHVEFRGHQNRAGVIRILKSARVGIVIDHPIPNYLEGYSTKLFEYMAVGLPVVASDFPLWKQIVEGSRCGLTVNPLDVYAVAEAVRWLLENPSEAEEMGRRGRAAVEASFNWEAEARKLLRFYSKVVQPCSAV